MTRKLIIMALLIMPVWPTSLILGWIGHVYLADIGQTMRALISSTIIVFLVVFVAMPLISRAIDRSR